MGVAPRRSVRKTRMGACSQPWHVRMPVLPADCGGRQQQVNVVGHQHVGMKGAAVIPQAGEGATGHGDRPVHSKSQSL